MTHTDDTQQTTAHMPEPWKAFGTKIKYLFDNGLTKTIADVRGGSFGQDDTAHANARRICAAVNACKGISTEAMESGVVVELLEACNYVQPHLEEYVRWHHKHQGGCSVEMEQALDLINAALTKATGRAA